MRGSPGRIWEVIATKKLAFSYHNEQEPEFEKRKKVLVYITEVTQLSLFADLPPKENCRRVLKDLSSLKLIGYID